MALLEKVRQEVNSAQKAVFLLRAGAGGLAEALGTGASRGGGGGGTDQLLRVYGALEATRWREGGGAACSVRS